MHRILRAASSWTIGLFVLAIFVSALLFAQGFPYRARLFPLFVIMTGIVLVLVEIVVALIRAPAANADTGLDLKADDDYNFRQALRAGSPILTWIAGLIIGIWLAGPTIAVPLWLILYFVVMVRASALATLLTVVGFMLLTVGLFDYLLQVPWPSGKIPGVQEWVQAMLESWGI